MDFQKVNDFMRKFTSTCESNSDIYIYILLFRTSVEQLYNLI
jgi:hypothetical protein